MPMLLSEFFEVLGLAVNHATLDDNRLARVCLCRRAFVAKPRHERHAITLDDAKPLAIRAGHLAGEVAIDDPLADAHIIPLAVELADEPRVVILPADHLGGLPIEAAWREDLDLLSRGEVEDRAFLIAKRAAIGLLDKEPGL